MDFSSRYGRTWVFLAALSLMTNPPVIANPFPAFPTEKENQQFEGILKYISSGWSTLTRSLQDCETVSDPKLAGKSILYLPYGFPIPSALADLQQRCNVEVKHLPRKITALGQIDPRELDPPGLLYLENPYVVPGGRFNEMYGWDSYFIIRGLLRDQRLELARGMVNNFLFEIEHYGAVLNANRTYYLTRSQPPFLSSMILEVYEAEKAARRDDRDWLAKAFESAKKDYALWTREEHLAGSTGLSRYYDFGDGPTPESLKDETDHYKKVAAYFVAHPEEAKGLLAEKTKTDLAQNLPGKTYAVRVCEESANKTDTNCDDAGTISLTSDFYKADRAMRESGFDISFRFGAYGSRTHHFAPVCLNSLLYKTEKDFEHMSIVLGRQTEARNWNKKAELRKEKMQNYLWDEKRGLFFDYNFTEKKRSDYLFATTFYPLWAGLATPEQARKVVSHLAQFEQAGGLVMTPHETGAQWDFPYAWAPIQLLAAEGMRHYGYENEAERISMKFVSMVTDDFRRDGTIREKYNAVTRTSDVTVTTGYHDNVVGFGWTNGVILELLEEMPKREVVK